MATRGTDFIPGRIAFTFCLAAALISLLCVYPTGVQAQTQYTIPAAPAGTYNVAYSHQFTVTGSPAYPVASAAWSWSPVSVNPLPPGLVLGPSTGLVSGTPTRGGAFDVIVQVSTVGFPTVSQLMTITVNSPAISATTAGTITTVQNQPMNLQLTATGGSPYPLPASSYNWALSFSAFAGMAVSPGGVITGTPTLSGTYSFGVTISDNTYPTPKTNSPLFLLRVDPPITITTASPLPPGLQNVFYSQTLNASGGTPPFTWIGVGLPTWLTLNSSGTLSGTPPSAGTFNFTAFATDSWIITQSKAFSVTIAPPLTITTTTLPQATAGAFYSQNLVAINGTTPYSWTLLSGTLPGTVTLSSAGLLSGTPSAPGTFPITVQVTEGIVAGAPQTDTQALTLTVGAALSIVNSSPAPQGTVGTPYSLTLNGTGGTPPYAWSAPGGLPAGLGLSGNIISGTPTASGLFTFSIRLTDNAGTQVAKPLDFRFVTPVSISSTSPLPFAPPAAPYSYSFTASGGTLPYTWSTGNPPPGLTLSSAGVLSGTPTGSGSYNFTVQVTDSSPTPQTTSGTFTLVEDPPLSIPTSSLPATVAGSPYSTAFAASGGTTPYTFSLSPGAPPGLTLNSGTGALTGAVSSAASYPLTLTVADFYGVQASKAFTLTAIPQLSITVSALPGGQVGAAYSQTLTAAGGGSGTYSWSALSTLPPGLSLSAGGLLSGTPTANGSFNFTVQVADPAVVPQTATASLFVFVAPNLAIATVSPLAPGAVAKPYSLQLNATGGTLPYNWSLSTGALPGGLTLSAAGLISGTPTAAGTFNFDARVLDSADVTASRLFSLTIIPALAITTASPLPSADLGVAYSPATFAAVNGTPPYSWSVTAGAPPSGMSLSAAGVLSGTPTAQGTFNFTVQAADSSATVPQSTTANFVLTVNGAITITTASPLPGGVTGQTYSTAFAATGGTPGYTFSVSAGNLPPGWTLSSAGALSGVSNTPGNYNFTVRAADSVGGAGTKPFAVTVAQPLSVGLTPLAGAVQGAGYTQTLTAVGGTPAFTWSLAGGNLPPGLSLTAAGVIAGTPTTLGTYNFTVRVVDGAVGTPQQATQALTIVVSPPLTIATASPLPNARAGQPYSQTLATAGGSGTVAWTQTGGALPPGFSLSSAGVLAGNPGPTISGSFTFTVQAADAGGQTQSKTFSLTVLAPLSITTAPPLPLGLVGTAYPQTSFLAAGGTPPYTWSIASGALPGGLNLTPGGQLGGTPAAAGVFNFTVQATDSTAAAAQSTTAAFAITIDTPIAITTTSLPGGAAGTAYSQSLAATGGTGTLTWTFAGTPPAWLSLSPAGVLSGTPPSAATYTFTVQAADSLGTSANRTLSIVVTGPLNVTVTTLPAAVAGAPYLQTLTAAGGTPPYTWSLAQGIGAISPGAGKSNAAGPPAALPAGMALSPAGLLSGSPAAAGTFSFAVVVQDTSVPPQTLTVTYTIQVLPGLSITTTSLPGGQVGQPYSQTLAATGGQGTYTWSILTGAVPGLTMSAAGVLSGTPTVSGSYNLSIRVGDTANASATASFTIVISPQGMVITTASPLPPAASGAAYALNFTASGGVPPYTFTVEPGSALPAGLSLSAGGLLSGTPTAPGDYNFQIRAASGTGALATSAVKQFALAVTATNLTITTLFLNPGVVNQGFSQQLTGSGGTAPYTWTAVGGLPAGLTLTPSGLLSGVPTAAGSSTLVIQLTDNARQGVTRNFSMTVTETPTVLLVTTGSLAPGTIGAAYSATLAATGGQPGYTWSLSGGALPTGLALLPGGTISGTPSQTGDFLFTVLVEDTASSTSSKTLQLTIRSGVVSISTSSVSGGSVGTPYSQSFAATGGTPPYTWTAGGSLPPGVVFSPSGVLSGVPNKAGTYAIDVTVKDTGGNTASKPFSIKIAGSELTITNGSPLPEATLGQPYSLTLTVTGGSAPYTWSVGGLPAGLTAGSAGVISGTPSLDGTSAVSASVADGQGNQASATLTLVVKALPVAITSGADLGTVQVGVPFSRSFAATGGVRPYTWSMAGNVPGVTMTSAGILSGTPGNQGSFPFTATATDSRGNRDTRDFSLTVGPPPLIVSPDSLPNGTVGTAYTATVSATGGTPPYRWSATGLPLGLTMSAAGTIGGSPSVAGSFTVSAAVTDASGVQASTTLPLTIVALPLPPVIISGPPATAAPMTQPTIQLSLSGTYPAPILGEMQLTFRADSGPPDPAVQFATGGTVARFTIPANTNLAQFQIPNMAFQTGSVAGVITVTARFTAGAADLTPAPPPTMTVRVAPAPPTIRTVTAVRTATGFSVTVSGFVTTREITQGIFRFNAAPGSNLQTSEATVALQQLFTNWYVDPQSQVYGSQFTFTQTFTVQGDTNAIASVSVTLSNSLGNSQAVTATLQ